MALSYKTAVISVAAGATATLVAAVAGKSIGINGFVLTGDTAATIGRFYDNDSNTGTILGDLLMGANGSVAAPFSSVPYAETGAGDALNFKAVTGAVSGFVRYSFL